jgi:hypothetical protein
MNVEPPKKLNLQQLAAELQAAGIAVAGLGAVGDPASEVFTYDNQGRVVDLPPEALSVVAAHVAGRDAATTARYTAIATALNNPTAYLDPAIIPSPTTDQINNATVQRGAWAAILGVNTLDIPVTQAATADDIVPLQ